MQRKDVERVKAEALTREDEYGEAWVLASDYAELLDRTERAEAELARCRSIDALQRASERMKQLEIERDEAAGAAASAEAERDVAFAAGQALRDAAKRVSAVFACRNPTEVDAMAQLEAALASPAAPETRAWAVVGEDGQVKHVTGNGRNLARQWAEPGDTIERIAIRRLEDEA